LREVGVRLPLAAAQLEEDRKDDANGTIADSGIRALGTLVNMISLINTVTGSAVAEWIAWNAEFGLLD
jgi:hypothetical protein